MTAFNVLTICPIDAEHDNVLYPVLRSDLEHLAVLEEHDSVDVDWLPVTAITIEEIGAKPSETVVSLSALEADLLITDARVILFCRRYDRGGGWRGMGAGALVAAGINAISMARAAARSHGTALAGHVWYPWLCSVGHRPGTRLFPTEKLSLMVVEDAAGPRRYLDLTLDLPKSVSGGEAARNIAHRAARHLLEHDGDLSQEQRRKLETIADAPVMTPDGPRKYAHRTFPAPRLAREDTAPGHGGQTTLACPSCGDTVRPGTRFCTACGAALEDA